MRAHGNGWKRMRAECERVMGTDGNAWGWMGTDGCGWERMGTDWNGWDRMGPDGNKWEGIGKGEGGDG